MTNPMQPPFGCRWCYKEFEYMAALYNHVETTHEEEYFTIVVRPLDAEQRTAYKVLRKIADLEDGKFDLALLKTCPIHKRKYDDNVENCPNCEYEEMEHEAERERQNQ